jgi:ABC-type amino acid transport substrate-binding protein
LGKVTLPVRTDHQIEARRRTVHLAELDERVGACVICGENPEAIAEIRHLDHHGRLLQRQEADPVHDVLVGTERPATETEQWNGDLDGMIERRAIRVLVPYSRTLYFNDRGRERGVTVDLFRKFELYINQKFQKQLGKRPMTVYIVPTTRDQLLKNVAGGLGDIAAGNLTVTDARREIVDFYVAPDQIGMSELVATGPKSPVINTADDLAGKTVHVRKASSYDKRVQGFKLHPTLYIFGRQAMSA